jgi:large repetitive protein
VEVFGSGAAGSTIGISSSANPSVSGQSVTYTATLILAPTGGTVAFADNDQTITGCGSQPINGAGNATCTLSYPIAGSHQIVASSGGSQSPNLTQTVNPAATTTQVSSDSLERSGIYFDLPKPSCGGICPVTFTASVLVNAPGAGTPTGTVQFAIDGASYGRAVPLNGGVAAVTITFAPPLPTVGIHTVSATYSGDSNFSASSGQLTEVLDPRPTCLGLYWTPVLDREIYLPFDENELHVLDSSLSYLVATGQGNSQQAAALRNQISALQQQINSLEQVIKADPQEFARLGCPTFLGPGGPGPGP